MSFRKLIEQAVGELMAEMAPTRPEIDPPGQRRRPDLQSPPGEPQPYTPSGPRPVQPAQRRTMAAPVPVDMPLEGRFAPREQGMEEGPRSFPARPNLRLSIAEGPPMEVLRQRRRRRETPLIPMRTQLSSKDAIRNAYRVMEILRPPVALRDLGESDRSR